MIRRECFHRGQPAWLLLSQPDHARLAGELAVGWQLGALSSLPRHAELLAAIFHHDDGWFAWERRPDVAPESGLPRNFTEMPLADSLAIWSKCVARAAHFGSLAACAVSAHFVRLLECSLAARPTDDPEAKFGQEFLLQQQRYRGEWLTTLDLPPAEAASLADLATDWLRFFDALSLWFCCAQRTSPEVFSPPNSPQITIWPVGEAVFEVSPWPWTRSPLQCSLTGRLVPARPYASPEDLEQTESTTAHLDISLTAAGPIG